MNERKLTKAELDKREDIIKDMKKNKRSLVKRYGKDAEKVMYGRATNLAKKQTEGMEDQKSKIREMVKSALSTPTTVKEVVYMGEDNYKRDPNWADYADIGQFSIDKRYWDEFSEYHNYLRGKSLTRMKFDGDIEKAYDTIVKNVELGETVTEDIDLGHKDDEPGMLKSDLYRIGKYAMELYQIMDKLDDGQEVDLPHWWQAKVIKAKDALVSAKHFLDFELKEPQIDQVTDMVDAKGQKYAIDEAMEGKPSQDEVDTFFSETQQEMHYLASKPVGEWDEYDMSNWRAKLKKKEQGRPQVSEDIKNKIAEMIKGAHSVMGSKSKKPKKPTKKDIKLAKDTQSDYEKSKDEEEDWESLAARSGASLEENLSITDWDSLYPDFSDADTIVFDKEGDTYAFDVDSSEFTDEYKEYVVDNNGKKHEISYDDFISIKDSYQENWEEEIDENLNDHTSLEENLSITDWDNLYPDFSDADTIVFDKEGDYAFDVDSSEFKDEYKGYVVDNDGEKHKISHSDFASINHSYQENWEEEIDENLNDHTSLEETDYKVAGRKVKVIKGKKSDGTDWKVELNGKEVNLSDVLALIEPKPKLTKESTTSTIAEKLAKELKSK